MENPPTPQLPLQPNPDPPAEEATQSAAGVGPENPAPLSSVPPPVGFTIDKVVPATEAAQYLEKRHKPSRLRIFFRILLILDILTIGLSTLFFALVYGLGTAAPGISFFLAIILFPVAVVISWFVRAGLVLAGITILAVGIYIVRRRPRGKRLVGLIIWAILSAAFIAGYFILPILSNSQYKSQLKDQGYIIPKVSLSEAQSLISSCQISSVSLENQFDYDTSKEYPATMLGIKNPPKGSDKGSDLQREASASDYKALKDAASASSKKCGGILVEDLTTAGQGIEEEISVDEATQLLNSCKLIGFYYTEHAYGETTGKDPETSTTGIILDYKDEPLHIHVADRLVSTMVPIARAAQKTCPNLQFWHDGTYEQKDANGNWQLP